MKGRKNGMLAQREARLKLATEAPRSLTAVEWEDFSALVGPAMRAAQAAQDAMNEAMQAAAAVLMRQRGLSPGEWALDVGKKEWVKHNARK